MKYDKFALWNDVIHVFGIGIAFGLWQENIFAGVFAGFVASVVIDKLFHR